MPSTWFSRATLLFAFIFVSTAALADQLDNEKARAKQVLKVVVGDIEKNYYDPTFHGENLRDLQEKAAAMIDQSKSISQVYTAIFGVVDRLNDSHTMFLPPGHGVFPQFGFEAKAYGDNIYVYKLTKKGGAREAGLQEGDRILQVNGFDADRPTFDKMMLFFHVLQPVGQLDVLVQRGDSKPQLIKVKAFVKPATHVLDLNNDLNIWDLITDAESDEAEQEKSSYIEAEKNSGIGYFKLKSFEVEPDEAPRWASLMGKPKGVIIDLRGNFGGAIATLVSLANHFTAEPDVMMDVVGRKKTEPLNVKPTHGNVTVPMVILVDSQSASCSEMFARHFQRTKRAIVIGDRTRGAVQVARFYSEKIGTDTFVPFGVQVTTGMAIFPNNENLEGKGVTPDQLCIPSAADLHAHRDVCYSQAMATLAKQLGLTVKEAGTAGGQISE